MSAEAEVMEKVADLLGEHFDAFVVVAVSDISEEAGTRAEGVRMEIGGGTHGALGLLVRAQHELLNEPSAFQEDAPE